MIFELASIREKYFALLNFGNILEWVLYTGHINASFNLSGSRHNLTFPYGFETNTKLLHHSAVLSMPRDVIISCCCSHASSSLNGLYRDGLHVLVMPDMACCLL